MPKAIRFHHTDGTEVLAFEELNVPAAGRGEARVRHTAIGVNFIDTYHRSGSYPLPLPSLFPHIAIREPLLASAGAVLGGAVSAGRLKVAIGGRCPLAEAARAHRDLEARRTSDSLVLLP